jgi:hypothetical protein
MYTGEKMPFPPFGNGNPVASRISAIGERTQTEPGPPTSPGRITVTSISPAACAARTIALEFTLVSV